jgi:hypothetical protein
MPVGGSRHYQGGGLGAEMAWDCPSCGVENTGPLTQGCVHCGAGRPGRHVGQAPPPPAPPTPPAAAPPDGAEQLSLFGHWAMQHPQATLEDAFTAGYVEGVREARRAALAAQPPAEPVLDPQGKVARTIVAALAYFADQVLRAAPQEVESGEWCSVDEVRALIHQLTTTGDVLHG